MKRFATMLSLTAVAVLAAGTAFADATPQTLPFSQDWSNGGLITANDDWSGVPGIVGYLGNNDAASVTGRVPCTIVGDSLTAVDVIANLVNPNTVTNGGVGEFDALANPTIALQGSGTADFPNIVLHLDTRCFIDITVTANLRDIDGSTDNAVQGIAVQYRVGSTGPWSNAQCFGDVTTGPSLATLVTPVNAVLPPACDNQPLVEVRFLTTNAVGNDEWVGVDDISVTGTNCPVPVEASTWSQIKARTN